MRLEVPRRRGGPILPCVTGEIELNFIEHRGLHVQAMALDCRTILGPLREGPERRVPAADAYLPRRHSGPDRRIRRQPSSMGTGYRADHTVTRSEEPAAAFRIGESYAHLYAPWPEP